MHATLVITVADGHHRVELKAVVEVDDVTRTSANLKITSVRATISDIVVEQVWRKIEMLIVNVQLHRRL